MRGERIGFIFQEFNLLPTLNAIENVMLPLRYRRGKDPDGKARAMRLLEEVDLADGDGVAHPDRAHVELVASRTRTRREHRDVSTVRVDVEVVGIQMTHDDLHAARSQ